jgi:Arc-like DNA binding domain
MKSNSEATRLTLRMPGPLRSWIEDVAQANYTSANAEIVRAIRERREREQRSDNNG